MGKLETLLSRPFPHVDHASFRDPATDAVLFPPGVPLPKLPPVVHLDLGKDAAKARPLSLSRDEERRLFLGMNLARHRAAQAQERRAHDELALWAGRADHVREYLVRCNTGLVPYCYHLRRKRHEALDPDHVFSVGLAALVRSVEKFDGSRGFKFSSYAVQAILNEIGRQAKYAAIHAARMPVVRLTPATRIPSHPHRQCCVEARDTAAEVRRALYGGGAGLTPIEGYIIEQRFLTHPEPTLVAVGESLGITKERVRQIQIQALAKLRDVLSPSLAA